MRASRVLKRTLDSWSRIKTGIARNDNLANFHARTNLNLITIGILMTDFKTIAASLEERGFCVIPEFLSRKEIDFLVAEFDASPDYSPPLKNKHMARHLGDQPVVGQTGALRANAMGRKETFQRIRPRMEAFAQEITGAKAALYQILYLQTPVTSLTFHQDHDHFFLTEYNRTHLNFWIPLVKASRTEAGLRLIPWDRLGEKSPRLFNLCRRSGASSLYSLRDGGTLYISDWSGVHWLEENLEIEEVMETPEVGSGDLLLLRVNTIHATQTTDDRRLAVSLRTCDPETPIDWHRVAGSPTPRMMKQLANQNPLSFPVFQHTQENHFGITLGDIVPTLTGERE